MGYVKNFRSIVKINESAPVDFTENRMGVLQISKAPQYQDIPELIKQLQYFENTSNIAVDQQSTGLDLVVKLIIAQLGMNGIEVPDTGGQYNTTLFNAVKGFQAKKGLPETGRVDHSTYNVLFGGEPVKLGMSSKSSNDKDDVIPYEKYKKLVALVIDKLEGGYYHPNMLKKNPKKFEGYENSGETLFGLDRHAGHDLYYSTPRPKGREKVFVNLPYIESGAYKYASDEARDFWTTLDDADAKNKWGWGDRGGSLEPKLRDLAGLIMKPGFNKFFKKYIDEEVQQIVKGDDRLIFHFLYATWNGIKFFQKFAKAINDAYKNGVKTADGLYSIAIESRLNTSVPKSAEVMVEIFGKPKPHKSMKSSD